MDDTGGQVNITDGGISHKYVEIRLNSQIGKALDYVVVVYANRKDELMGNLEEFWNVITK